MIRIFNHYVHRASLQGMLFDLGWVLLVALVAVLMQVDGLDQVVTLAGTHVVSFAACLAVIGGASGLYEPPAYPRVGSSWSRALLVLLVALPLAYAIFGLLPSGLVNRGAIQWSMMAGVAALILRRAYMAQSSATPAGRARILIYGAGPAAEMVGRTLKASDPNAHIVGYVAGPNEREPSVPVGELLTPADTLSETAARLRVDEIVVALTERQIGRAHV